MTVRLSKEFNIRPPLEWLSWAQGTHSVSLSKIEKHGMRCKKKKTV